MDKELKAKWVKALRSGKYEQGRTHLHRDGHYCCLGVLLDVAGAPREEWDGACLAPFCDDLRDKYLEFKTASKLAEMNDSGDTFAEIANYIEANL